MGYSAKVRGEAEYLFVRRGLSLEEIAGRTHVAKGTLARWSKQLEWVKKRDDFLHQSPSAPLEKLYDLRRRRIEDLGPAASPGDVDSLYKLDCMIERMEAKREAVGPILDVLGAFANFVARKCEPPVVDTLRNAIEQYLADLRSQAHG